MTWDYFVWIAENSSIQEALTLPEGLAGGFVDEVSVRFFMKDRENARNRYRTEAGKNFQIPEELQYLFIPRFASLSPPHIPNFVSLPSSHWLGLLVDFELLTPWYSKDDRVFHVLDNPVRKDRVFGVPYMAASSWKGLLRWAFQMHMKLIGPEGEADEKEQKRAKNWELYLFGNEKDEKKYFQQGALVFYPTWFDKIGYEVINPHSRSRRAGTQPIYYEVVPPGAKGTLYLLYAPLPGMKPAAQPKEVFLKLLEAIEELLTTYGISAKRTVGWGTAKILTWRASHKTHDSIEKTTRNELWEEIQNWFSGGGTP